MRENQLDRAGEAALYQALRRFWHPVLWADELGDRPVAATLLDEPLAIVRLGGEVRAFKDLCVHRGTALSLGWVEGDRLVCAYHGWTYDPTACAPGSRPATGRTSRARRGSRLRPRARRPHLGLPRRRAGDAAPRVPGVGGRAYRKIKIPQYDWHCSAARRVENFVDFSHFAWVHEGILGDRSKPEIPDHDVDPDARRRSRSGSGSRSRRTRSRATPATPGGSSARRAGTRSRCRSRSTSTSRSRTATLRAVRRLVPVSAKETRNFTWNARNYELDPAGTRASSTSSR